MRSFFKFIYKILCLIVLVAFLISCFTQFIHPTQFSFIALFSLAFPYLFLLMIALIIFSFFVNKRMAIFLLICLLCGYKNLSTSFAFNFSSQWNAQKQDSSLRIMTWNVEDFVNLLYGSEVRAQMLNLITQNNPDVLCVQEFTEVEGAKWRASVRKELDSMGYKYCLLSKDQSWSSSIERNTTRGTAIFSKLPFLDSCRFNVRKHEMNENAVYATILFNNKPLRIYTTHLASFQIYKDTANANKDIYKITYDRKRAVEYRIRETEIAHEREVKIIRDSISKSPYPVIYCGDINSTPCSYTYRMLKNNLQDAFLTKGFGIGATFYKILPTLRIDVCLVDPKFKIDQCTVVKRKLSDHYPIVTDIRWK
ncbi:MAG TPA: endonuclease/exonuclease/phosphatase family protein [Parafilimonas sp.]|nr:endonuclease/exonuclease/phosphatase family protein [Parafilimonas sp.]